MFYGGPIFNPKALVMVPDPRFATEVCSPTALPTLPLELLVTPPDPPIR